MEILDFAKHRYPFILVDKIVEFEYLNFAKCIKNVSYNEPWVPGHYPDQPIYPGALLIESMAQASAPMLLKEGEINHTLTGYLVQIDKVKFIHPIFPGDQILFEAKMVSNVNNYYTIQCIASVDGRKMASAKISYLLEEGGI